jgi:hypothetical protein
LTLSGMRDIAAASSVIMRIGLLSLKTWSNSTTSAAKFGLIRCLLMLNRQPVPSEAPEELYPWVVATLDQEYTYELKKEAAPMFGNIIAVCGALVSCKTLSVPWHFLLSKLPGNSVHLIWRDIFVAEQGGEANWFGNNN